MDLSLEWVLVHAEPHGNAAGFVCPGHGVRNCQHLLHGEGAGWAVVGELDVLGRFWVSGGGARHGDVVEERRKLFLWDGEGGGVEWREGERGGGGVKEGREGEG